MEGRTVADGRYENGRRSPAYIAWCLARQRCNDPNSTKYHRYGGRGITVCERWNSFENFLADMGPRPPGATLDRWPDTNGNYEPGNCRWATQAEQQRNRTNNKLTYEGALDVALRILSGEERRRVAEMYGISAGYAGQVARGVWWRDARAAALSILDKRTTQKAA